jgi:hypothetical protein
MLFFLFSLVATAAINTTNTNTVSPSISIFLNVSKKETFSTNQMFSPNPLPTSTSRAVPFYSYVSTNTVSLVPKNTISPVPVIYSYIITATPSYSILEYVPSINTHTISVYVSSSYSPSACASPTLSPIRSVSINPNNDFDSYFLLYMGIGIIVLAFIIILCVHIICKYSNYKQDNQIIAHTFVHNPVVHYETSSGEKYITERGITYYFDGESNKIMAQGWRRFSDTDDIWYVNSMTGESSWEPVYRNHTMKYLS